MRKDKGNNYSSDTSISSTPKRVTRHGKASIRQSPPSNEFISGEDETARSKSPPTHATYGKNNRGKRGKSASLGGHTSSRLSGLRSKHTKNNELDEDGNLFSDIYKKTVLYMPPKLSEETLLSVGMRSRSPDRFELCPADFRILEDITQGGDAITRGTARLRGRGTRGRPRKQRNIETRGSVSLPMEMEDNITPPTSKADTTHRRKAPKRKAKNASIADKIKAINDIFSNTSDSDNIPPSKLLVPTKKKGGPINKKLNIYGRSASQQSIKDFVKPYSSTPRPSSAGKVGTHNHFESYVDHMQKSNDKKPSSTISRAPSSDENQLPEIQAKTIIPKERKIKPISTRNVSPAKKPNEITTNNEPKQARRSLSLKKKSKQPPTDSPLVTSSSSTAAAIDVPK